MTNLVICKHKEHYNFVNKKAVLLLGVKRVTPFGKWSSLAEPEGLLMFHLFVSLGAENMGVFTL